MEIWKDIKGYEGYYQISNKGNVKSLSRQWIGKTKLGEDKVNTTKERILKPYVEKGKRSNIKDSLYTSLRKDDKNKKIYIHRLVASHFIPNPNPHLNIEVNHIDGNRMNNSVENLEWVTKQENIIHAFNNELIKTRKKVKQIDIVTGETIAIFEGENVACKHLGVSQGKILRAMQRNGTCGGYKWEYI